MGWVLLLDLIGISLSVMPDTPVSVERKIYDMHINWNWKIINSFLLKKMELGKLSILFIKKSYGYFLV